MQDDGDVLHKSQITYPSSAWNQKGHQETLCAFRRHPTRRAENKRKVKSRIKPLQNNDLLLDQLEGRVDNRTILHTTN